MVNFNDDFYLNPGFLINITSDDRFVLIGEMESFILKGRHYRDFLLKMKGPLKILDVISYTNDIRKQVLLLSSIEDMVNKGLIHNVKDPEPDVIYVEPDFDTEPNSWQNSEGNIDICVLSKFDVKDTLIQWAEGLDFNNPTGIVIVDDYLDPRIEAINRRYMEEKRSWLLIKPTGIRPMIGPVFRPGEKARPCWKCLSTRLIHNQPVRKWLQNNQFNTTLRIPIRCEKKTVKKVLDAFSAVVIKLINQPETSSLMTFDHHTMEYANHPVSILPQCPACGDPGALARRNEQPVRLQASPKTHIHDGGVRSFPPRQTLERLQPLINNMTGIVGDLSTISNEHDNRVPIYRTFFFKTPKKQDKPTHASFMQISLGKGMSEEQSMVSAVCETLERYAVQFRGDEACIFGSARSMENRTIQPMELATFSDNQYQRFHDSLHTDSRAHYAVERYNEDIPIHWTQAWSLKDGKPWHIPLTFCYANTPFGEDRFSRFNSNGCAAGNTLEEALLQGFLELVERDAVAIWWYNKIIRPPVSMDILPVRERELIRKTLDEEWDYWVLDLTHDFQIPVMAAVSKHKQKKTFRLGFGCHINPVLACQRSLTELCQLIAIKNRGPAIFNFDAIPDESFLLPKEGAKYRLFSDYTSIVHADIKDDMLYCIEKAARHGLMTLAVDYSRPDIPLCTARVIVPGLCHIWPQFGNSRLYTVPEAMGWRKNSSCESQLNPCYLLI